jgi:hypothetical protein
MSINESESTKLLSGNMMMAVDDRSHHVAKLNKIVYYEVFLVTIPLFMGYAALFSLQNKLKMLYNIDPISPTSQSELFGVAVSFLYLGNLVFRLSHNVLFGFLSPRQRVILAMSSMAASMVSAAEFS